MLEVCSGVTNEEEKDVVYKRSYWNLVRGAESDRSSAMCYVNLIDLNESGCIGESASPFIDEEDGLTSERERVRTLLSIAAHASGYKMMVDTHNTVYCQMHLGGCVVFF